MLIAVDHGNYSIKTPNFSFVAGLAEHTVRPITDDYLEYDGRFWTLTETRLHYMRDKTQDNRYFVGELLAELHSSGLDQIDGLAAYAERRCKGRLGKLILFTQFFEIHH